MIPSTTQRVPQHTTEHVNAEIRRRTEENIARHSGGGSVAIERRLRELEREWDMERTLEANASIIALLGLTLGATVSRKWFVLPGIVTAFLLQHAIQGWCPPVPIFRRLGFRTQTEIEQERYALKAVRGDFQHISHKSDAHAGRQALEAARS